MMRGKTSGLDNLRSLALAVVVGALGAAAGLHRAAHGQADLPRSEVRIEVVEGFRTITANGLPDHATGTFPNRGNPNRIAPQSYRFRMTATPSPAASETPVGMHPFGIAVNGVPFDPGAAEFWNGDRRWQFEPLAGYLLARGGLGVDDSLAHVQPNGAYHYHGLPTRLLDRLEWKKKMALIGYAADGYPIYGPYAYTRPGDATSPLKLLRSSYRVRLGNRPSGPGEPGGAYDGSFTADFEFVLGHGDLDACNGRTGVTPEYPKGTYYYVVTQDWPFVPRRYRGTPDASFLRQGPPGGGQRGPGLGGPPGPPAGLVPGGMLGAYLELSKAQKEKLRRLTVVVDRLRQDGFHLGAFEALRLTAAQIDRLAAGERTGDVLTAEQQTVLTSNRRPGPPR